MDILYNGDEVFQAYGVHGEPTHIVLDKQGQIRLRADNSFYFYRINELVDLIQELVQGE